MESSRTDKAQEMLVTILRDYGREVCEDRNRLRSLLADYCGSQQKREINLLLTALDEHVPGDLLSQRDVTRFELLRARMEERLRSNRGLEAGAASWAIASWAKALGLAEIETVRDAAPSGTVVSDTRPSQEAGLHNKSTLDASQPRRPEPTAVDSMVPAAVVRRKQQLSRRILTLVALGMIAGGTLALWFGGAGQLRKMVSNIAFGNSRSKDDEQTKPAIAVVTTEGVSTGQEESDAVLEHKPLRPEAWADLAWICLEEGEYQQACDASEQSLRLKPGLHISMLIHAAALFRLHDRSGARDELRQVAQSSPQSPLDWHVRGCAYVLLGELGEPSAYDKAIADLDRACQADPTFARTYRMRAQAQAARREFRLAVNDWTKVLELCPEDGKALVSRGFAYYDMGRARSAEQDWLIAISKLSNGKSLTLAARGEALRMLAARGLAVQNAALAEFDAALLLHPNDAALHAGRGQALASLLKLTEAIDAFDRALQLDGGSSRAYSLRARTHFSNGDFAKSIDDYTQAIDLQPNGNADVIERARVRLHLGQQTAAQAELREVLQPHAARGAWDYVRFAEIHRALRENQLAIDEVSQALALDQDHADSHHLTGQLRLEAHDIDGAIAAYSDAIELDPNNAVYFTSRAAAYRAKRNFNRALEDVNHVVAILPRDPDVIAARATLYDAMQDYDRALTEWSKLVEINPSNLVYVQKRAACYRAMGRTADAAADYQRTIDVGMQRGDAASLLVVAYAYNELNKPTEVIEITSRALDVAPELAAAYQERGYAYLKSQELENAIADFDRSIQLDSSAVGVHRYRGDAFERKGAHEAAIKDYSAEITLSPEDYISYNSRGSCYYSLKRYEHAIHDHSRAIDINPGDAALWANRADDELQLERYDEALADLNRALEIKLNFPRAYRLRAQVWRAKDETANAGTDEQKAAEIEKATSS